MEKMNKDFPGHHEQLDSHTPSCDFEAFIAPHGRPTTFNRAKASFSFYPDTVQPLEIIKIHGPELSVQYWPFALGTHGNMVRENLIAKVALYLQWLHTSL